MVRSESLRGSVTQILSSPELSKFGRREPVTYPKNTPATLVRTYVPRFLKIPTDPKQPSRFDLALPQWVISYRGPFTRTYQGTMSLHSLSTKIPFVKGIVSFLYEVSVSLKSCSRDGGAQIARRNRPPGTTNVSVYPG